MSTSTSATPFHFLVTPAVRHLAVWTASETDPRQRSFRPLCGAAAKGHDLDPDILAVLDKLPLPAREPIERLAAKPICTRCGLVVDHLSLVWGESAARPAV